jgi:hypothetical protein
VNAQILGRLGLGTAERDHAFGKIGRGDVVLQGGVGREAAPMSSPWSTTPAGIS